MTEHAVSIEMSLEEARLIFNAGRFDDAAKLYLQLINSTKDVEKFEAQFGLGMSYYQLGKYADAFQVVCSLADVVSEPCVYELALEVAYHSGRMNYFHLHAPQWYEKTQDIRLIAHAVRSHRFKGNWLKGVALVDGAISSGVESIELNCEALMMQIDSPYIDSKNAFDVLMKSWQDTLHPQVGFALAYACIRLGRVDKAVEVLDSLGEKSFNGDFLFLRGWCHALKGDILKSEQLISMILEKDGHLDNGNPYWLIFLSSYYLLHSRWNAAAVELARLLNGNEGLYLESRLFADLLLRKIHNYDQAYVAYMKIAAVNAASGEDLMDMAWISYGKGDIDECTRLIGIIENFFGQNEESSAARLLLAMERKEFLASIENVGILASGKGIFSIYYRAILASARGNFSDAYNLLMEGLAIYPSDRLLGIALTAVLIEMSRHEKALECAENFLKKAPADFSLRSMALYCTAILGDAGAMSFHDEQMAFYCADQYEEWLKEKTKGDDAGCAYILYCQFLVSKLSLFRSVDEIESFVKSAERYFEFCEKGLGRALLSNIFCLLLALDDDVRCAEFLDKYSYLTWDDSLLARYHCRFSRYEVAEKYALKAIQNNRNIVSYDVLIKLYMHMGCKFDVVDELLREALSLYPENKRIQWNAALVYQSMGYVIEADRYYGVGLDLGVRSPRKFIAPLWNGESLFGKKLLLWREQGVGDEIYAIQWYADIINLAKQQGGKIKIECDKRLERVLKRNFPRVEIEAANLADDLSRSDFDFHLPVFDLRKHFFKSYPSEVFRKRHIKADIEHSRTWKDRVSNLPGRLKVGICWKSGLHNADRDKYYASIEDLAPLFEIPNISWVMLNYSEYQEDAAYLFERFGVTVHMWDDLDLKNDFEGCAALIENLDLVISAGSTPGMFANILGVPVWFFAYGAPCVASEPTYYRYDNYPALTWLRHYSESYRELFVRMAQALREKGVIAAPLHDEKLKFVDV